MVNKENVRLWVEELRSGNYKQVAGRLRDWNEGGEPGYCCLGIACLVYWRETGNGHWDEEDRFIPDEVGESEIDSAFYVMPKMVHEWLGFRSGDTPSPFNPMISPDKSLAGLNDDGVTFAQIADIIESTWLGEDDDDA